MNKKRRSLLVLIVIALIACSSMLVKTSLKNSEKNSSVTELADVEVKDNLHSSVTEDDNMYIDEDVLIEEDVLTEEDVQSDKKTVYLKEKVPVIPSASNSSTQENDENQDKTVVNKSENSSNSTSSGGESSKNENAQKPEKPQEQEKPQEPAKPQEPQKPQVDGTSVSADIKGAVDENNKLTKSVQMKSEQGVQAVVPAGVKIADGTTTLKLTITEKEKSDSDVTVEQTENLDAYDIHIEGIAADNKTPITIELGEVLSAGLNKGNLSIYHVENGKTVEMTEVASTEDFTAHNQFAYNPENGALAVAMMSFSEVAVVSEEPKWEGNFDYSWYTNAVAPTDGEAVTEYTIANADQLAAFGAIVGGMDGQTKDSFNGKTVKLISDINLGDKESENNPDLIFYPIGYYNSTRSYEKTSGGSVTSSVSSFEGTFDGNGHTIENFYQNTWEMFGDYNDGYSGTPNHYKDAMGLFGYVANGTVKNLTVNNFSSDGEFTPTGVIAAYAANATFENIAITNCNPRVYNTGNGGIVGIGGNSDDPDTYKLTFNNITIDNTNKISALWGSWDVACGGLVGMFRGAGHVYMTNCHVASQIDVYNDVCGNYQYYWYRYSGMMVGTNKNMITDDDGYTVPETSKFHAEKCTVHFGEWNDYYYCELVANSLASYTHDHQFSRLEQITSLDEIKSGDTWIKTGNFLLISGDTKTCYHIVKNADGTLKQHFHTDAGEETVNGETVLKENNQIVYLPFNQLFTGYGWGVKHIPVYNGEDYAFEGIEILDREVANSEVKFEAIISKNSKLANNKEISIGELFKAAEISDEDLTIKGDKVHVAVSPVGEYSTVSAEYTANSDDWTKGTLLFSGEGTATITITDYYFCTPTTITVNIVEREEAEKFAVTFPNVKEYIYRVGNVNTVTLGSLFKAADGADIRNVSVAIENVSGDASGSIGGNATRNVSGEYLLNEASWTDGKIQFVGSGIVKVTITDNKYCIPTKLMLEVVNATNVTEYKELKDQNSVLLNKIEMSSGGTYRLTGNKTLYGNGFTFDVTKGAYAGVEYDYASYVIYLENSCLDNVEIIGAVYPELGGSRTENYHRAIVMTNGDCQIKNCYISNGASPIRNGGNLELINTTLKGGIYANLDLRNGHLILDNVTTINQIGANDKYNNATEIIGMGIVVYQEGGTEELKITIKNELNQYNYLSELQADTYLTNSYAKAIKNVVFSDDFTEYKNGGWINFGIISMNNFFTNEDLDDQRKNEHGYFGKSEEITSLGFSRNCYVYSFKPTTTGAPSYDGYSTLGQGIIAPEVKFDFTVKNYQPKVEGSNDYCYEDSGIVYISMDEGDTFNWDTSILEATKNGKTLTYTAAMEGVDYTNKSIAFNTAGRYEISYSYTDPNNYSLENNQLGTFEKVYTETITIEVSVVKAEAKHAEFSFGANGTAYSGKTVTIGDKTYVMPDVTAIDSGEIGSKTVSGTVVYYPITKMYTSDGKTAHTGSWYACFPIFKDAVQIVDYADNGTGDPITYNQTNVKEVALIPSTLKATDPKTAFLYSMNATNYPPPTDPTAVSGAVCYTCNRNGLTASNTRKEENTVAEYTYTDNAGTVYYYYIGYHCEEQTKGTTCVTPDTLITLADGTQKRIDEVEYTDSLLVWDFYTGKYAEMPAIIVFNMGTDNYEVLSLEFDDGTVVKIIEAHRFFDVDMNNYVDIKIDNVEEYLGHKFVKLTGDVPTTTKLISYSVKEEYTTSYSIMSACHYNFIVEGLLSDTFHKEDAPLFEYFDIGDDMKFDEAKMQEDIEKYGLYTYEEFADYLTEEQFDAFNVKYMKISVGKGKATFEDIITLIETYVASPAAVMLMLDEIEQVSAYEGETLSKIQPDAKPLGANSQQTTETNEPISEQTEQKIIETEPEAPSEEPKVPSEEPEAPSEEPEAPSEEPEAPSEEPETPSEEPEAPSEEPEA